MKTMFLRSATIMFAIASLSTGAIAAPRVTTDETGIATPISVNLNGIDATSPNAGAAAEQRVTDAVTASCDIAWRDPLMHQVNEQTECITPKVASIMKTVAQKIAAIQAAKTLASTD